MKFYRENEMLNFGLNYSVHNRSELSDYCVVGASSFFKGYFAPGLIWAGVPAKAIKINEVGIQSNSLDNIKEQIIIDARAALVKNNE